MLCKIGSFLRKHSHAPFKNSPKGLFFRLTKGEAIHTYAELLTLKEIPLSADSGKGLCPLDPCNPLKRVDLNFNFM